jgi:hypothetical protein
METFAEVSSCSQKTLNIHVILNERSEVKNLGG